MDTATAAVPGPVRRIRHTPLPQATGREMMSLRVDVASTKPGPASTTAGITTVTVLPDLVGPSTYACISNDSP